MMPPTGVCVCMCVCERASTANAITSLPPPAIARLTRTLVHGHWAHRIVLLAILALALWFSIRLWHTARIAQQGTAT
eukprot:5470227-Alexandrium_andersonii.AAC.1